MAKDPTTGTRTSKKKKGTTGGYVSDTGLVRSGGKPRTSADKKTGPSKATRAVQSAANPQRPFAKAHEVGGKSKKKK